MANDDWLATAQSNTAQLGNYVKELEHQLDRREYREFWNSVKSVSQLDYNSGVPHDTQQLLSYYSGTPVRHKSSAYHVIMLNGTESPGDNSTHSYANPAGMLRSDLLHSTYTTGSLPGGAATVYAYDGFGNPLYEYQWESGDLNTFLNSPGASNAAITTRTFSQGNVTSETDLHGDQTQYTFDGNNLYATDIYQKDASGAILRHFQPAHDFASGLLNSIQDVDNAVTNSYTYDQVGRVTQANEAGLRITNYAYDDANRRVVTTSNLGDADNQTLESAATFDQAGRLYLSRQMECNPSSGTSDDSIGIKQMQRYMYSGTSRYEATSNPYRGSDKSCSTVSDSAGWSLTQYDVMNRPVSVTTWDGSAMPVPFATNSGKTGQTTTVYDLSTSGPTTQIKVQTGTNTSVSHTNTADALGRLISVSEDGIGSTTQYTYDVMGNLIGVQPQGSPQTCAGGGSYFRYFTYDPLGRLTGACNPETGLTTYVYDDALNQVKMTRGGIMTTTTSDGLNRIVSKTYSDSTPSVTWTYDDPAVAYSRGRLTKVTSSAATRSILAYDALGRVLGVGQTVDTFTAPGISHTWNMATLNSTTLPSGNVVNYTFDGAGRVKSASGTATSYASAIQYAAQGAIVSLPRGDGVTETTTYNSRQQPVTIQAGNLLTLSYDYGGAANNGAGVNNNGNVLGQTITRSGQQWAQAFGYDGADRLTCANEVTGLTALPCGTGTPGWSQTYGYDAAGNRAVTNSSFPENLSAVTNTNQYSASTNRIAMQSDGQTPMPSDAYDSAGNLHDHPAIGTFNYDAENRIVSATVGGVETNYAYDGEGRRVSKTTNGATTRYVYDGTGELAAEYPAAARPGGTQYLTTDALGSTRLVTGASGAVVECEDYLPFGEQLTSSQNGRSGGCFSAADVVPEKKFTGKERDLESGLDFFGARYFSAAQGRFTSPDKPFADQHIADPQSWNLYSYGRNNPLRFVDDDGQASVEYLRRKAVTLAKEQERALIRRTGAGTRDWTSQELETIKDGGWPEGYYGHHINNVASQPDLAGDPNNIDFLDFEEHMAAHNGGNTRIPVSGSLLARGVAALQMLDIAVNAYFDYKEEQITGIHESMSPFSYGQTSIVDPTQAANTLDGANIRVGGDNGQIYHIEKGKYSKFGCTDDPKKCSVDGNTLKGKQFDIVHVTIE